MLLPAVASTAQYDNQMLEAQVDATFAAAQQAAATADTQDPIQNSEFRNAAIRVTRWKIGLSR